MNDRMMDFLFLLNAQKNTQMETQLLSREILEQMDDFAQVMAGISGEPREYAVAEIRDAVAYMEQTAGLFDKIAAGLSALAKEEGK